MKNKAIKLQNTMNHLSSLDIEEILEWLSDEGYFNESGKKFRTAFWETFIKINFD